MTKLKIVIPKMHISRMRQIAKTKHDLYVIEEEQIIGYEDIFTDKENNKWKTIALEEFKRTAQNYDLLLLTSHKAYQTFNKNNYRIKKAYGWTNVCNIFPEISSAIKHSPVMICTSNNWSLRPQDRTVTIGIDEKEYPPRDYDEPFLPQILCPINNYKTIGQRMSDNAIKSKRKWFKEMSPRDYFKILVGYDWRETILNSEFIKVCGFNPLLLEEDGMDTRVTREVFKKWLRKFASVLVPSPFKHQSNVIAEAMTSKNCVITRPSVPFRVNPSPLRDGYDCIMVKSEEELRNIDKSDFFTNKKKQKSIAENALITAQISFDMKICINKWEEFFEHSLSY